jgi:hypothetical protein
MTLEPERMCDKVPRRKAQPQLTSAFPVSGKGSWPTISSFRHRAVSFIGNDARGCEPVFVQPPHKFSGTFTVLW